MQKHLPLSFSKSVPLSHLYHLQHIQTPFSHTKTGLGYAGVHKKDIGSMGGAMGKKKIAPLRFRL